MTVVLILWLYHLLPACRFYDQELGTLPNGLPRMLDMGQCNDAYSALVVATVGFAGCAVLLEAAVEGVVVALALDSKGQCHLQCRCTPAGRRKPGAAAT